MKARQETVAVNFTQELWRPTRLQISPCCCCKRSESGPSINWQSQIRVVPRRIRDTGCNHQLRMTTGKSLHRASGNATLSARMATRPVIEPWDDQSSVDASTSTFA